MTSPTASPVPRLRGAALLLLLSGLCWAGCREHPAPSPSRADQTGRADQTSREEKEFAAGADRPPTSRTLYASARFLAAQQRDAECEAMLIRILRDDPDFMPAYCDLAQLRVRQRRIDDAIDILQSARRRSPRDPVVVNDLGMCNLLKNDPQAALGLFTKAASLVPDNARYRANMAVALGLMGRYEESLALYRQIVSPQDAEHNVGLLRQARTGLAAASQPWDDNLLQSSLTGLPSQSQPATQ